MSPALISNAQICANHMSESVSKAIRTAYGREPYMAKRIAADADVPVATAKRWARGAGLPSTAPLLRMMQARRAFREALMHEVDPDVGQFRAAMREGVRK